jgi:hypothetical protein
VTVTSLGVRNEYTAIAGQTVFNYTFLIFGSSDLNVYITTAGTDADDATDITTAYTITSGIGLPGGGAITLNSGATIGDLITIVSNIDESRITDYQESGDFESATVNADFDRVLSLVKQQLDSTGRTLSFPQSLQNAFSLTLPLPVPGQYVVWNSGGSGLINAGAPGTVLIDNLTGTTAQMVANASLVAGDIIPTTGKTVAGDGGDNMFLARAVTGASADGGALIKGVGNVGIEFVGLFPGGIKNVKQWGAVGDGVADDEAENLAAVTATSHIQYLPGTYLIDQMPSLGSRDYIGIGTVQVNLQGSGDTLVSLKSDSRYEYMNFTSLIADKNSQRAAIDDEGDVYVKKCSFNDFLNPSNSNGWGILIQRSSRITIDECSFSNNEQSDIALTDDVFDVTIINPKNTADSGVYLNFEPNSGIGIRGCNVIGGHYRRMDLLENDNTVYSSQGLVISGARIDLLVYDGSGAVFTNCAITAMRPEPVSLTNIFAGQLMIDTLDLDINLLTDETLFDVSPSDGNSFWTSTNTGTVSHKRINSAIDGKYLSFNPDNEAQGVTISTRTNIAVTAGENLILFMRGRMDNTGTATNQVDNIVLQWFDSGSSLIQNTIVKTNRGPVNVAGDWTNDVAVVTAPALATTVKFRITNSFSSTYVGNLDVASVGLFRFNLLPLNAGLGNMNKVIGDLSENVVKKDFYRSAAFLGTDQTYGGCFVGERVILTTPVVGQPKAWACTVVGATGFAGTLVSEGNL